MNWHLLFPALVCAVATFICGHETLAMVAREDSWPIAGAALTIVAAVSTIIAITAVFP